MGLRGVVSKRFGALLAGAALVIGILGATGPAEARHRHRHYARQHHHARPVAHVRRHVHIRKRHARAAQWAGPPKSEIVVDGNSGRVLYAHAENELRHPASLTKVMTLYLLFEQLEKGKIGMDSEIPISAHAASMAPSKLGLRPGSHIEVEDAIKSIVTKSANDIAVAVAEYVGGSEPAFADMMTRKAHALGMTRTHYANASGLPNPQQLTTAHDLAILGRAIQERFPKYYRFFSTRTFVFRGQTLRNHNHMLGRVQGMDGIKTGYTNASGFNLLTSVHRDGRFLVSVVLGGATARSRDQLMARLIEAHLDEGSRNRTALAFAARDEEDRFPQRMEPTPAAEPVHVAAVEPARIQPAAAAEPVAARPALQPRRAESDQAALHLAVPPAPIPQAPAARAVEKPRPAYIPAAMPVEKAERPPEKIRLRANRVNIVADGSTARHGAGSATATPSNLRWVVGAQPARRPQDAARSGHPQVAKAESKAESRAELKREKKVDDEETTASIRKGWIIQIGATDELGKAKELLSRAKDHSRAVARAHAFTEKVQKGRETLYRARFAGLEERAAEAACRDLKRSGFACFTMKN